LQSLLRPGPPAIRHDDYDVLAAGVVVGRILSLNAMDGDSRAFGHHEDGKPKHGYEANREDGMAAFCQRLAARMKSTKKPRRFESGGAE
jgi:hypothetical protein